MNRNKFLMIIGTVAIILFIIWFYFKELALPERVLQESTMVELVKNVEVHNSRDVKLSRIDSQGAVVVQAILIPEKR